MRFQTCSYTVCVHASSCVCIGWHAPHLLIALPDTLFDCAFSSVAIDCRSLLCFLSISHLFIVGNVAVDGLHWRACLARTPALRVDTYTTVYLYAYMCMSISICLVISHGSNFPRISVIYMSLCMHICAHICSITCQGSNFVCMSVSMICHCVCISVRIYMQSCHMSGK